MRHTRGPGTVTVHLHSPVVAEHGDPRFSVILRDLAAKLPDGRVSIGQLLDRFGRRGHGALLIVLGAPNIIPLPMPGLSLISGLPLLLLTAQIALGLPTPWLPVWLRDRTLKVTDFQRLALAVAVKLERVERLVRPRMASLTTGWARSAAGLVGFVLAAALCLPLPLGNALPGLALALLGLALLERDGMMVIAAFGVGLAGMAVVTLAGAAVAGAVLVFLHEILPWLVP